MVSQAMLLNKILNTKDISLITQNGLDDKYFYNYKTEFNFIMNHYDQYHVVPDKLTFLDVFPNFDIINEINEPDTFLLSHLYEDYNKSVGAIIRKGIKDAIESDDNEKLLYYSKKFNEDLRANDVLTSTSLFEDTSRYDRYLDRTHDQAKYYLTTGFKELDQVLGGIDRENENMVIMARPGVGKTQILLYIASAAAQAGLRVGIFEGEMTADKVGYRIDTFVGHIKNSSINRGDIYVQKDYKHYIDTLASRNLGPIKVMTLNDIPGGECTVDTLKAFIEKEQLDILLVDQYDLMEDKHPTKVEHEHVAYIAKDVKKLQVEKKIPIISVCQMTRQKNEDGSQDTSQAAGSDKISRYATTMIALEQKLKDDGVHKSVELTLNIIKARDGGDHNKLVYTVDFNTGTFSYVNAEGDGVTSDEDFANIGNSYEPDNVSDYSNYQTEEEYYENFENR